MNPAWELICLFEFVVWIGLITDWFLQGNRRW